MSKIKTMDYHENHFFPSLRGMTFPSDEPIVIVLKWVYEKVKRIQDYEPKQ